MSSSVVSPAQWSGTLPVTTTVDSGSSSRRPKKAMPALKKKSTSPAPTTSTRSTRSRKTVTYSESDSPELANGALPPVAKPTTTKKAVKAATTPKSKPPSSGRKTKSTRMSRTASTMSQDSQRTDSQATTVSPTLPTQELAEVGQEIVADVPVPGTTTTIPAPKSEVVKTAITPEPVKADLPPSASTLRISFTNTGGIKRRPLSQDPGEENEGSTAYDETPRISPNPDTGAPLAEEMKIDGPKRAPRKKRKWLKRGEVDPDDPVAVARQQERFGLLDKADEYIEKQMEAVRNGTHPDVIALHAQLTVRKDRKLQQSTAKFEYKKAELMTSKLQAQTQARSDNHEESERIVDDLRADRRRTKHKLIAEKFTLIRNPRDNIFPILGYGRGSGGWSINTEHLVSNHRQKLVGYEHDGRFQQRKDITMNLESLSARDARADMEEINRHPKPSPPPDGRRRARPRSHFAMPGIAGPSAAAVVASAPAQRLPNQGPGTGAYEVTDLPPYKAGAVPMRQTPTHSPTPTGSRRTSPQPQSQPAASSSATVLNRYPNVRPPGQAHIPAVTSTLVNGSGPIRSGLSNSDVAPNHSAMYAQPRRL